MYLGFYPKTVDRQKIACVGTLLTDTALAWHLHRYRELQDNDTWANYSVAIRAEYHNKREGAEAQAKIGQLRYQGSIRAYMTEFRALNNFAHATGEGLREKVDLAMTDAILDMRFSQNAGELVGDEEFLHATYRAGIQVEKRKALRAARELVKLSTPAKDGEKKAGGKTDAPRKEREMTWQPKEEKPRTDRLESWYGRKGSWATKEAALKGVPTAEREEYGLSREDCWQCGRSGPKTYECFSFNTKKGTALPPAPWKVSATGQMKQKGTEDSDEQPSKQQKIAAVETMEIEATASRGKGGTLPWDDSDSDF